ncbi:MAG: DNA-binding protein [Actinomyces sp.]|nr:DNA-binding protein [Actinomyces sp.]
MSNRPARIRTIVVAVLVLAFVIPWTYAHIAYAWPWKRFQTGTLISCDSQYSITFNPRQSAPPLGFLPDGTPIFFGSTGRINMGVESAGMSLTSQSNSHFKVFARVSQLHCIVWFTPNPGGATFCFTPDPTFTVNPYF